MPFVESYSEFNARHGGNPVPHGPGLLYPDGATADGLMRREPPTHPHERATLVVRYWEVQVRQAEGVFEEAKRNLLSHADALRRQGVGLPLTAEVTRLRELQAEVIARRRRLTAARKAAEQCEPEKDRRRRRAAADARAECDRLAGEVSRIKV